MLIGPHSAPHVTYQFAEFAQRLLWFHQRIRLVLPPIALHTDNKIKHYSAAHIDFFVCTSHSLVWNMCRLVWFGCEMFVELFLELAQRDNLFPSITNARINLLSLQ